MLNEGSKFVYTYSTALLYFWINTITRTLQKCGEEHININGRFLLWLGSRKYTINTIATIKNLPNVSATGSINQSKLKSFQKKIIRKKLYYLMKQSNSFLNCSVLWRKKFQRQFNLLDLAVEFLLQLSLVVLLSAKLNTLLKFIVKVIHPSRT